MNDIFMSFLRRFVVIFFDDILVYSRTWPYHLNHLQAILKLLQLYAKLSKCGFGITEVEYLGYVFSEGGISMENSKP